MQASIEEIIQSVSVSQPKKGRQRKPCTFCGSLCQMEHDGKPMCWLHHPESIQKRQKYVAYYNQYERRQNYKKKAQTNVVAEVPQ